MWCRAAVCEFVTGCDCCAASGRRLVVYTYVALLVRGGVGSVAYDIRGVINCSKPAFLQQTCENRQKTYQPYFG